MTQTPMTQPPAAATAATAGARPGGLTALAVLNLVFGGLGVIANLITIATVSTIRAGLEALAGAGVKVPSAGTYYLLCFLSLITGALLITAGIGYLGQKKMLGWTLGNAYGVLAIVICLLNMVMISFGWFGAIFGIVYPIITLALLNTKFKNSFPNP